MYKQLIIVRKDLEMSPGKLAAQVAHGSMAFLLRDIEKDINKVHHGNNYKVMLPIDINLYEEWMANAMTKVVLGARNKNHLLKAVEIAEESGMKEGEDFFFIYDQCRTELKSEGPEGTLTVLGFRPVARESADIIGRKFQLL